MAWGNDAIDIMASRGRAPAFDARGNIKGFKTKPGSPMADPTQNKGAINSASPTLAGTPTGNWNSMFRNKLTGTNPLAPVVPPTSGVPHVDTALSQITGTQWGSNNDFSPGGGAPDGLSAPATGTSPSLDILAAGGPTHAQTWGSAALTGAGAVPLANGFQTGNTDAILKKYQTPNSSTASYGLRGAGWPATT